MAIFGLYWTKDINRKVYGEACKLIKGNKLREPYSDNFLQMVIIDLNNIIIDITNNDETNCIDCVKINEVKRIINIIENNR